MFQLTGGRKNYRADQLTGDAYRNPKDPSAPMIGEEIAAARALIALGTDLLVAASANIERSTKRPVHLYR